MNNNEKRKRGHPKKSDDVALTVHSPQFDKSPKREGGKDQERDWGKIIGGSWRLFGGFGGTGPRGKHPV